MIRLLFISFLVSSVLSCANPSNEITFSKTQIQDEVNAMLLDYHEAVNAGGLIAEFEYLDHSEDFFWVPPGYKAPLTYDEVEDILKRTDSTLVSVNFQWESLSIFPLSNEICNYSGIVKGHMIQADSSQLNIHLIESGTLVKRNDGWKLLSGQSANL